MYMKEELTTLEKEVFTHLKNNRCDSVDANLIFGIRVFDALNSLEDKGKIKRKRLGIKSYYETNPLYF